MPHIVGNIPGYVWGTGTMVCIGFGIGDLCLFEVCDVGIEVHVAICARRSTVSSGNLTDKSSAEPRKVKIDQLAGFIAGSRLRYDLRTSGVELAINVGIDEERNVTGIKCDGISQEGWSVFKAPRRDRGPMVEGVRINLVLAVSIGLRRIAATAEERVAINTVVEGDVEFRMAVSGRFDEVDNSTSVSAIPRAAAMKLRMKVSMVDFNIL
jgi:hypothetical protein